MIRKIIKIDEKKCNGCGLCAAACHENAIGMIDGKATLLRDDYCDGLGDCLPVCPTNAITFVEREALEYDEQAVQQNLKKNESSLPLPCGCPGTHSKQLDKKSTGCKSSDNTDDVIPTELSQWPVKIQLVPINAPYFNGAHLLIAADCTAYAYGNFHARFIKNHIALIGCPKLDMVDYSEKLTAIIKNNSIKSVKVVRMEVPCCGGIEHATIQALKNSGKFIPWQVVTISVNGEIID